MLSVKQKLLFARQLNRTPRSSRRRGGWSMTTVCQRRGDDCGRILRGGSNALLRPASAPA